MSRRFPAVAGLLLILIAHPAARGATTVVERFSSSLNGWTNSSSVLWIASNGYARAAMAGAAGPPAPQSATLVGWTNASSGAFTGNYEQAGIQIIGFKFFAERAPAKPDVLRLEWTRQTNAYFKEVSASVVSTGRWYFFAFALSDATADGWAGSPPSQFTNALQAVDQVQVYVQSTPGLGQTFVYRVDDIFLESRPAATAVAGENNSNSLVTWSSLLSNEVYQVQARSTLDSTWSSIQTLVATSRQHTVVSTNDSTQFLRLVLP